MTWFKKVLAYSMTADVDLTVDTLQAALSAKLSRPLGADELRTYGFTTPLPRIDGVQSSILAHPCGAGILICAESWFRNVPSKAVRAEVDKKVSEIEAAQDRKVKSKERRELKELVVTAMIPKLVPDCKHTTALILPAQNLILVDTGTPRAAEDLLSTLREVLGTLPIRPLRTIQSPTAAMTSWLKSTAAPESFTILDYVELAGEKDGKKASKVRLSDIDLASEEVQLHLATGRRAFKLALTWENKVTFKLNDKLIVESIKFDDLLQDDATQAAGSGDVLQHFDASMTIMSKTLGNLITALANAFGGEERPALYSH